MSQPRIWLAWTLGSLLFFLGFVLRVSPSVMVQDLMRDFSVGAAILGNLSACYFYAYASLQVPVGLLMDKFGPRRLLAVASIVCGLGSLLFAVADNVWLAYAGRVLIGAGAAFGYVGTMTISTAWFAPAQFAFLVGLLQTFGMVGAIGGQAPLALLVESFGWRDAISFIGILLLLLAVAMWLVIRDKPQTHKRTQSLADGLKTVVRNKQSWVCAGVGLTLTAPMLAFAGLWAVPFLKTVYGFEATKAASLTSTFFIGWAVAAPLMGWWSDRVKCRKPFMLLGTLGSTMGFAFISFGPTLPVPLLIPLFMFCGFAGATMVTTFSLVKELNSLQASGAALGLVNTAVVGSGALMQPLIGLVLDLNWDGNMINSVPLYSEAAYRLGLSVLPAVAGLGLVLSMFLQESFAEQRG